MIIRYSFCIEEISHDINLKRIRALKPRTGTRIFAGRSSCRLPQNKTVLLLDIGMSLRKDGMDDVKILQLQQRFDSFTRGKLTSRSRQKRFIKRGSLSQTFPMDFRFTGNKVDIARQIGNAVHPTLAEQIGRSIISVIREERKSNVI